MPFNSYVFWGFFLAVITVYWRLRHRAQNRVLLVASYLFYGWWDWRFLFLILFSTSVDYIAGRMIDGTESARSRKQLLAASLLANLGLLAFFKYLIFFTGEFSTFVGLFGSTWEPPVWVSHIVLPLGISFYTFQTLSYTIDIYRRKVSAISDFGDYALYVAFFPQLVAGPIERSDSLLPQILKPRERPSGEDFSRGLCYILIGLFMKLFVADNLAQVVNHIFALPADGVSAIETLAGAYAFAFQIYGDFAGYSYTAQGLAILMGFRFRRNFSFPYLATSPQDFWQRWHISLTTWFRDYVFLPLLNQIKVKGMGKIYIATMLTWLISGFWHGAAWTFLLWGGLHGIYLIAQLSISRKTGWNPPGESASLLRRLPFILITFHLICVGMILFRAETLSQASEMFASFTEAWSFTPLAVYSLSAIAMFATPLMLLEAWSQSRGDPLAIASLPVIPRTIVYSILAGLLFYFPPEQTQTFIYFQF